MNLADSFEKVLSIANVAASPTDGWKEMLQFLGSHIGPEALPFLEGVAMGDDVERIRKQIANILASEPPTPNLDALYFGLFDALDERENECLGFYMAGIEKYDEANPDCLCNPAWLPEHRYLASEVLDTVKAVELRTTGDARQMLGYAGQLGAALLLVRFGACDVAPDSRRLVGFDSGDVAELQSRM